MKGRIFLILVYISRHRGFEKDDKMNKREYKWPISGSMRIENVINVVAGIYIHLKASMKI